MSVCLVVCLCLQMYVNLLFWYQFFCGFSGSVMTNSWVLIFFNLLFTSVPPLIYGVLDRHTPAETLMELPELYQAAQTSRVTAQAQDATQKPTLSKPTITAAVVQYFDLFTFPTIFSDTEFMQLICYAMTNTTVW